VLDDMVGRVDGRGEDDGFRGRRMRLRVRVGVGGRRGPGADVLLGLGIVDRLGDGDRERDVGRRKAFFHGRERRSLGGEGGEHRGTSRVCRTEAGDFGLELGLAVLEVADILLRGVENVDDGVPLALAGRDKIPEPRNRPVDQLPPLLFLRTMSLRFIHAPPLPFLLVRARRRRRRRAHLSFFFFLSFFFSYRRFFVPMPRLWKECDRRRETVIERDNEARGGGKVFFFFSCLLVCVPFFFALMLWQLLRDKRPEGGRGGEGRGGGEVLAPCCCCLLFWGVFSVLT